MRLDGRGTAVRFLAEASFSLLHDVQAVFGVHPTPYPMDSDDSFPRGKAAEASSYLSPPPSAEVKNGGAYLHSPYVFMAWCLISHMEIFAFTNGITNLVAS
jgi:hypothetical protein